MKIQNIVEEKLKASGKRQRLLSIVRYKEVVWYSDKSISADVPVIQKQQNT